MKLRLVGTSAIVGKRRSACSLIDNNVLIDCGNGLVKTLQEQGIDLNGIETVLITHLHADHFLDVPFFVFTRAKTSPTKSATIYCPKGTEKIVEHICDDYVGGVPGIYTEWKDKAKVEFNEFEALENQKIANGYSVTAYLVDHGAKKPAYGYIVCRDDISIGFSGDSGYCKNIDIIVEKSDVAVLDMCRIEDTREHMGYENIRNICERFNKRIIVTHMTDEAKRYAKDNPVKNLIIPEDGEIFDVNCNQ